MKAFRIIASVVIALAAIAGIAYVVMNYGDRIVAWFRKIFGKICRWKGTHIFEDDLEAEIGPDGILVASDCDFEG